MNTPQQGPATATVYKREYDIQRIEKLDPIVAALQKWRDADHEPTLALSRNDVVNILEGIYALRRLSE